MCIICCSIFCYNYKIKLERDCKVILADIGNTRVHIWENGKVIHLSHQEAISRYGNRKLHYITVKVGLKDKLAKLKNWEDISNKIILEGSYKTMGVDRKALCLSRKSGIFISAGSAITIDIVENSKYLGGFLLLGLTQYIKSYSLISPILKTTLNRSIDINQLPKSTRDGISYGIIAPIKAIVEQHRQDRELYISGGDGRFLSSFFANSIFDESLIFQGIINNMNYLTEKNHWDFC